MCASLGRTGLLYVGDCKLDALATRMAIHHTGDTNLRPLGLVHLPAADGAALIDQALAVPLTPISRPVGIGPPVLDVDGPPVRHAKAWDTTMELTGMMDDHAVT